MLLVVEVVLSRREARHASMRYFVSAAQRVARRPLTPCLSITHRRASSMVSGSDGRHNDIDVDAVTRPMGYGPFSATAKARVLREKAEAENTNRNPAAPALTSHTASVMRSVTLQTNLPLRLSLAGLPHPSQLQDWAYKSSEWRLAFIRLYRAILRLHNKAVAVSLHTARGEGPEAAVSAVTGVHKAGDGTVWKADVVEGGDAAAAAAATCSPARTEVEEAEDYLLRYLLTPEQQEFGNRFVFGEFQRHMDADAVSATIFYASWYDYVLQLASGVTSREMTEKEKRLLSDEQKEKLNALHGAFLDLRASMEPQYMP
ncbi:hypothetical protein ABL78_2261 [Leptomonas seymouri]|uniref:Succinate dehydrogenase assembly factor 3 n=1 Tax=Leptomonas seymouri TaxID=5684 RepID=A0A0N0P7R0_LEPSE|nr:hypothetical protein ABL78_2261 [Leptomonas seymouri]|eukprot:KPI88657.1 hypothetical protein ABL78_2261 [Leptomonas seymouri]